MRLLWVLTGCGSVGGYVGEPVVYDELPAAFATATCDRRVRCGDLEPEEWEGCFDRYEGIVWSGWLDEGEGCADYDAQWAGNCVAAHEQAPCDAGNDFAECSTFQLDVCRV